MPAHAGIQYSLVQAIMRHPANHKRLGILDRPLPRAMTALVMAMTAEPIGG